MSQRTITIEAAYCPLKKHFDFFYPYVDDAGALTTSIKLAAPKNTHFSLWFGKTKLGQSSDDYVLHMTHKAYQKESFELSDAERCIRAAKSTSHPDYIDHLQKGVGVELRKIGDLSIQLLDNKGCPDESNTGNITLVLQELSFSK